MPASVRTLASALAIVFALGFGFAAGPARAQTGPALELDGLKTMLAGLNLQPSDFRGGFLIKRDYKGLTLSITFFMSGDKTQIGMNSFLGNVDPSKTTAQKFFDLLAANRDTNPGFFFINRDDNSLNAHRALDNHGLTPDIMRSALDNFSENVVSTQKLWSIPQ